MQPEPTNRSPEAILQDLVALIEEIRVRRQAEAAECLHPELKTFSQRELTDVACPSYKNYLLGRTSRLPAREMVIEIADYLECTPAETDDLLVCAGYLPNAFTLREDEYRAAVGRAELLTTLLPLPTVVIGRYGETLHTNPAVYTKIDRQALGEWQPETRNIISYFFDPDLAVRDRYAVSTEDWQQAALSAARLLYLTNAPRVRDPAFRRLLRNSRLLPGFAEAWDTVISRPPSVFSSGAEMRVQTSIVDQPIRELLTVLPITQGVEVSIVISVPVDEGARHVYELMGCAVDVSQWAGLLGEVAVRQP